MKSHARPGLSCLAVAIASLSIAPLAVAQGLPNANAGRILESAPPPPTPERKDDAALPSTSGTPRAAAPAGATVQVRGFRIVGNTVFPDAVLQPLVAPWVGKSASTDDLLDATEAIKNRYKDAGYFLTQVLIPAQDVADGVVELRVVEAHIGRTQAQVDSKRVPAGLVDGYMNLLPNGSPVTEQGVERPLLLLNDLPGVHVTSVLKPGANFGEADLDVKVGDQGRTFSGDGYIDNAGNQSTGYARVGADLYADGLLGFGEQWSLGGLISQHDGIDLVRGGVTMPVGPYGTKVTASLTDLNYKVVGSQFNGLDADGYALVGSVLAQHPVVRSRNFNLFAVGGIDAKDLDDRQQDGANHDHRVVVVGNLGVSGDFRDQFFGGSLNSFTFTLDVGHNDIRTLDKRAQDANRQLGHQTEGSFQHVDGDFQRLQAISDTTSVLLSMRGQYAFQNLDSSEKSSLGGPHGVRAYAVGDGVGDDLFAASLELRQRIPQWTLWEAPFIVSAFIDGGRVWNWHDPLASDINNAVTLGGFGVGLNLTSRDNFQFRLDVAHKINGVDLLGSDNRATRVWASLQKWF